MAPSQRTKRPSSESRFKRNEILHEPEGALAEEPTTTKRTAKRRKTSDPASEAEVPATNKEAGNTRVPTNDSHLVTQKRLYKSSTVWPSTGNNDAEQRTTYRRIPSRRDPADSTDADHRSDEGRELSKATAGDIKAKYMFYRQCFPIMWRCRN